MNTLDASNSPIETHFEQVHAIIDLHRSRALRVVNNESLFICWNVGQYVSEKLQTSDWGNKVVTQLSEYLRTKDPSLKGYSRRNIYNMVSFYEVYSSPPFLQLLETYHEQHKLVQFETAQLYYRDSQADEIVQFENGQLKDAKIFPKILSFINWTSHVEILNKCRLLEERLFYMLYAYKERLEVKELQRAIKTNAYAHVLKAENNQSAGMKTTYPESNYLFKDVAYLDFLGLLHNSGQSEHPIPVKVNTWRLCSA